MPTLIAAVAGGGMVAVLVVMLLCCLRRRRRQNAIKNTRIHSRHPVHVNEDAAQHDGTPSYPRSHVARV